MRHRVAGRRLSRTSEHRLAMRRNLVASLIEHETISTTIEKAKEVRPLAEKLITIAKKGTLAARRQAIALLGNREIVDHEDGKTVAKGTIIGKLFSDIGPRYLDRPGGYTRIIRLSMRRLGDNGQLVLLQLVGQDEGSKKEGRKRSRKKARTVAEPAEVDNLDEVSEAGKTLDAEGVAETEDAVRDEETAITEEPGREEDAGGASPQDDQTKPNE
ncbi:MAG: 50S ribosomal protein L17 [Phycisphaerales bacterium]|nr:MAG: 50S ribosomal protein L17 [Phycisphaerales bacterium]